MDDDQRNKQQQEQHKEEQKLEQAGLPEQVKDSPYTKYKDLEDYKEAGYGVHGHQQPQHGRGAAASTDAPTSTRGTLPLNKASDLATTTDTVNQHGEP